MPWTGFDIAWPWIGLGVALVLLGPLLGSDWLRGDRAVSRWRDPAWLSWLGMAAYLVHNCEEYGIDLFGRRHAFSDSLCTGLGMPAYPDCPVPPAFFLGVNIALFWIAAPLVALLGRRHPLVALSTYGVVFINFFFHAMPLLIGPGYSPGTLTAFLLFLPVSLWVAHACFGTGRLAYRGLALVVADGVIVHSVLMGSLMLFVHGMIGGGALVVVQVANAALFLLVAWLGGRWLGDAAVRAPSPAAAI